MFVYKEWEKFCQKLNKLEILSITANEALEISKTKKKYIIIKHDVETDVKKALKIAKIENLYNVRSTFYVQSYLIRNSKNLKILKLIQNLGHELTYHYDVLDSNDGNFKNAMIEFEETINEFNKSFNKVKTVCPHGNPIKKRNGWSSNKDFFRNIKVINKFSEISDIVLNPEKFINGDLVYISDVGYGWKLISSISENDRDKSINISLKSLDEVLRIVEDESKTVIISSHPHRWVRYKIISQFKTYFFKLIKYFILKFIKFKLFKSLLDRFYYLAKKI